MFTRCFTFLLFAAVFSGCSPSYQGVAPVIGPKDTPESLLGERLFRELRFSKFFVREGGGNPNAKLAQGDPALAQLDSPRRGELRSPFATQAMSCVACHMVDDAQGSQRGGMRVYADFAERSPIPQLSGAQADGQRFTARNSPSLVNAFMLTTLQGDSRADTFLLHYDGEFASIEDLIVGGYTGRNFGWLPGEKAEALANLARVVREDSGDNFLADRFSQGASYREMFLGGGEGGRVTDRIRIGDDSRFDLRTASDEQVIAGVSRVIKLYLQALQFSTDPVTGEYNLSAYDQFLAANHFPRKPAEGETDVAYASRLGWEMQARGKPVFVPGFGARELDGARIFLARSREAGVPGNPRGPGYFQVGNCVACHAPPHFTDFRFHDTGESQDEFDAKHGQGSFSRLHVPTLAERAATHEAWLPATGAHPHGTGLFRGGEADLGAWNVFANPDFPTPQNALEKIFGPASEETLSHTIASFKTPGLRGLAMSDPYLHTGRKANLGEVLRFYQRSSEFQRQGALRNGDPQIGLIEIDDQGAASLKAFLDSLNEDYE